MEKIILDVSKLSASYGPIRALRGVSLQVREGETVAVVGANGAGKTSLMRAVSGLLPITGGSTTFDGFDIGKARTHHLAHKGMLHVPEGRGTLQTLRVRENLQLAWEIRPTDVSFEAALGKVYDRFPRLLERSEQLAGNLSGGEQQMLAVARAIINQPRLLLLDEPSMGLSPLLTTEVFKALAEIRDAGVAILIVEQNVSRALRLADRAMVLTHGEITLEGPSSELAADPRVLASYMGQGAQAA
jgi:branched-chain amino acid transport system ATP-binding protein